MSSTDRALREGVVRLRGVDLTYFEWGKPGDPQVLLVHATGFHARCWDRTVEELGPDFHAFALDMRGHGRSTKQGPYEWNEFGADVSAFVEATGIESAIGVGHSMGGHSVVQAASKHRRRFSGLLLVDPVIMAPDAVRDHPVGAFHSAEDHPVSRRRYEWDSPDAMFERFKDRHPFRLWRPDVLRDYCDHGVIADGDRFVLACPPVVEASIYLGSGRPDLTPAIESLPHPVTVMRAHKRETRDGPMDFSQSPTWEGLAAAFPNGRDVYLPDLTHFIPMQRPDLVATHIRELANDAA